MRSTAVIVGWLTAGMLAASQDQARDLLILSPDADTVLSGRSSFSADVIPPTAPVRYVALFVDGTQVCRMTARPYTCSWDAGPEAVPRSVRVVAEMADGLRLVKTLRTTAQASGPSFRAATDVITVPVDVRDNRGHAVMGLSQTQFQLQEDGQAQQISTLLTSSAALTVLLGLDVSASMEPVIGEVTKGARAFLEALRPQDAVSIAAFNTGFFVIARAGSPPAARNDALDKIRTTGTTALYDSMVRAADLMKSQPAPRVIVMFTDGVDTASRATLETVRGAFQTGDIALYLVLQGEIGQGEAPENLARLARETGGVALFAKQTKLLREHFTTIVNELKNRYVLVYSPSRPLGDGAWREIAVEVAGKNDYTVRSRTGYLAQRSTTPPR
ncbi:MAG: VWA domain-containing protein [Vicinamibacterales bacterium]